MGDGLPPGSPPGIFYFFYFSVSPGYPGSYRSFPHRIPREPALRETVPPDVSLDSPGSAMDSPDVSLDSPGVAQDSPDVSLDSPGVAQDSPGVDMDSPGEGWNPGRGVGEPGDRSGGKWGEPGGRPGITDKFLSIMDKSGVFRSKSPFFVSFFTGLTPGSPSYPRLPRVSPSRIPGFSPGNPSRLPHPFPPFPTGAPMSSTGRVRAG